MKRVLITGGNKGIGKAITEQFIRGDFEIFIVARSFTNPSFSSKNVHQIVCDLSNLESIHELKTQIGDIEILINNAGIMHSLPHNQYPHPKRDYMVNLNLIAPVELIEVFSPGMINRGSGSIINIASIAGFIGHSDIWYGVTKAGLINLTKSYAKILAPFGITSNCVAPGPVEETSMFNVIPEDRKQMLQSNTYTRTFAKPDDIAQTVYWLATEAPRYINGICIDINNGAFPR